MMVLPGVAAGHPATVEQGVRILREGGTAADAAVAAILTACAAESIFTGLCGGGFATYFEAATGQVTCLDFFCAVPGLDGDRSASSMRPVSVYFGEVPIPYEIGGASVAVPGVVAGCGEIHARWGRLPWSEVVQPSVKTASEGVLLPAAHAAILPMLKEAMLLDQGRAAYAPGGTMLTDGQRLYHAGLASALELIGSEGPEAFYTGALGARMSELARADGGVLGMQDLAQYRVMERKVMSARIGDFTVYGRHDLNRTMSTLAALGSDLTRMSRAERVVRLARLLQPGPPDGLGETTNLTVVDAEGNACVATTTLGLGAGLWVPGYGVHLNSMLGEGELNVGDQAPGDRISSMMCPLVALDDQGGLALAIGSAGASRIRSALLETLIGVFVDGMPVAQAVAAPRLHAVEDLIHVEPDFAADEEQALVEAGFEVNRWTARNHHYFGGVSAVGASGAAGDPRRAGVALLTH